MEITITVAVLDRTVWPRGGRAAATTGVGEAVDGADLEGGDF